MRRIGQLGVGAVFKLRGRKTLYLVTEIGSEGLGGFSVYCLNTKTLSIESFGQDTQVIVVPKWKIVEVE